MASERKLTAILAADVAGYSRLMGVDEEATLGALRSHRELIDGLVAAHRGRIFSTAGDSIVAEFPSAVEAALCAIVIQRQMAVRNEAIPGDRRLQFRIGINIGDVVVEDGNLYGEGVNIAARIQELADPGGICIARNVHDQLRNQAGFSLEAMGEYRVKNIIAAIAVYRVVIDDAGRRPRAKNWPVWRRHRRAASATLACVLLVALGFAIWHWQRPNDASRGGFPSLAVLPFENFSGDAALDRYSDAVAESITTVLSRFPDITVVSRNSAFGYKGKKADIKQIGRELGVEYIVEGSVQRNGRKAEITAQLIDMRTNLHVWAEQYEGEDLATLQEEATIGIGAALPGERGQIRANEYNQLRGKERSAFSEYDYFLTGQEIIANAENIEDHDRGGAILQEGLERFPDSALLRVHLAWYHFWRPHQFITPKKARDYRRAAELARAALASDDISPIVQWSGRTLLAYIEWQDANFERAVANAEAAVARAPYDANTLSFLARVQIASGNVNRGIAWLEESTVRKPQLWRNTRLLAWAYYLAGDYEKSIESARKHVELSREWAADALAYQAASYANLGRMTDAKAAIDKLTEVAPTFTLLSLREDMVLRPYKDRAVGERELADLARVGLPELPSGYDAKAAQRLTAEEMRTLIFGHTMHGRDVLSAETFTDVVSPDGTIKETAEWGNDTATLLQLDRGLMCHLWTEWGPSCSAILRNPDGSPADGDEFVWVFTTSELRFSIRE
jgi:adenylate cyclase